ncbi:amidohydrolase family protein [Deinococcus navajonensis]|uniref:Amidohydrolase family protein n=1 Tax=Deinococcus navajonensis TaxID=309884 RepID=A0ABV8XQZ3_9DEIO
MTPARMLALTGRLFDGEILYPQATVLMHNGTVLDVGERLTLPAEVQVLEAGPDGTILPGLIDLHVHARSGYASWFPEAGVTTIRDAGNSLDVIGELRTLTPSAAGPRLFASGAILDGEGSIFQYFGEGALGEAGDRRATAWIIRNATDAVAAVDALADAGVETIKLYEQLPSEAYQAAVRRAQEHGLPVMTDLGTRWTRGLSGAQVDALQALKLGVRTVEHASGFALAFQRLGFDPTTQFPDDSVLSQFARAVIEAGAVLVPTLSVPAGLRSAERQNLTGLPHGTRNDEQGQGLRGMWDGLHTAAASLRPAADWDARLAAALTWHVLDQGGEVGAGTDTPAGVDNLPGGGLHAELAHLVREAHLTPLQALRAATGTAGRLLAGRTTPEVGLLRPGALADALIVGGDPSLDITATRRLRAVIQGGRLLQSGHLASAPGPAEAQEAPSALQ